MKRRGNRGRAVVAALLMMVWLVAGAAPALAAKNIPATVKSNTYIYQKAKTTAKKKKIKKATPVTILGYNSKWAKVKYGKVTGYILKSKLKADKVSAENGNTSPATSADYDTLQEGDTGAEVKKLQTRLKSLNWFHGDIGGNYKTLTKQAVTEFQAAARLSADGIADAKTQQILYSSSAPRLDLSDVSTATPAGGAVREADWWTSGISSKFVRGGYATVTDVATGISFRVYRGGGTNHADVQPATAADTAAMKRCYGGSWSWTRRAIWVSIGGVRYAASMNGMPHGGGSVQGNNFNGHFCIHFTNSRTHGTNKICPQHQAAIKTALAAS